jgi:hypothetical protein
VSYYDNVGERTATTGTGPVTLAGALSGYQAFSARIASGARWVCYRITSGTSWEVGYGLYTPGALTLTRQRIFDGTSGPGTAITLSGTSNVYLVHPAENIADTGASAAIAMRWAGR